MRVAVLGGLLAIAGTAAALVDPIQPGDRMLVNGATHCTLSFVFDGQGEDADRVFLSIASHCVAGIGESISTDGHDAFGVVVLKGDAGATATDLALVEVTPEARGAVRADVRGHPGIPTGVADAGTTGPGDAIVMSGWGFGFEYDERTREMRQGVLLRHDAREVRLEGPVLPGDSGGPWTLADGRALAIVSKISAAARCCDPYDASAHQEGSTVQNILATAAAAGFDIGLRTA